jgi:hypothetical protein
VFVRVVEPHRVTATIEAGLNALGRRWREGVAEAREFRRAHPGPWYIPADQRTSPNVTMTLEPCAQIEGGCWVCDPLSPPVCGVAP